MLTTSPWVAAGIVNGCVGTMRDIVYSADKRPTSLPEFVVCHFPGKRSAQIPTPPLQHSRPATSWQLIPAYRGIGQTDPWSVRRPGAPFGRQVLLSTLCPPHRQASATVIGSTVVLFSFQRPVVPSGMVYWMRWSPIRGCLGREPGGKSHRVPGL